MQIISLSQNKFKHLTKLDIPKEVFNQESVIYDFRYRGEDKVFKKLFNNTGKNLANKLYTLEMLDYNRKYLPDCLCIPDYLVSVGGLIEGFTMPKIDGITFSLILNDKTILNKEKIFYLKSIGMILHQLDQIRKYSPFNEFYLNDIHDSNFIVNPNKKSISVVDIDSSRVFSKNSFLARFLTPMALLNNVNNKYILSKEGQSGYVIADRNSDIYCYIIMILNYLYGENINNISLDEFYDYLDYLRCIGVSKDLVSLFSKIISNEQNENPYDLLDSLSDNIVLKSNKEVFIRARQ